jgi:hypothetical protein
MSLVFRRYSQIKKAPHVCDMRGLSLKGVEGQEGPTSVQEYNLPKGNRQRMPRIIPTGASDPCGMNLRSLWINSVNIGVPYFTWFYLNANKHFTWRWTMCQHQFWEGPQTSCQPSCAKTGPISTVAAALHLLLKIGPVR